ncbi:hypothetical protein D6779_02540 [Candidatus Parcubacteria bacterium]|nr:MAG: hypothetical protein D6779_02540 [Candidatus Parcubacteria bacterium]
MDILAETRLHPVVFFLEQAVTLRELGSMIASILVLFSVFANQDLVEAIAVQGYGWGFLTPLVLIYISWLFWKWKNRRSFGSFLSTLAMAWCLAFGVMAWLDAAWDKAFLGDWHAPEFWRVFLFFALMADAGARAIRELRLERFLSREEDR